MTEVPDELNGVLNEITEHISTEVSDTVADSILDDLIDDLPPKLAQELQGTDLEPLVPSRGVERFLNKKSEEIQSNSVNQQATKLEYVERYLTEVVGIENLNNLTPRQVEGYRNWRKYESLDRSEPLAKKTLKDDMHLYKGFLKYLARIKAVPADAYRAVDIPELTDSEGVDTEILDPERADDCLKYLGRFKYASREHVVWLLMTKTGRRPVDLRALDIDDFDDKGDEATLAFVHRPDTGTPLKRASHEAVITLGEEIANVIRDFIDYERPDQVDECGRKPLLATDNGRIAKSTIKEYAYKWTRPCEIGNGCPFDKNIDNCEAATCSKKASKCDATRSPRKIRSGYITVKLNQGVSYESLGYRVGATKKILKQHYDHPEPDEERKRHRDEIMETNRSDSGYANGGGQTDIPDGQKSP